MNIIILILIIYLVFNSKIKELFYSFDINKKTTYVSIPKKCFEMSDKKWSKPLICKSSGCLKGIKLNKEFTFIKTPCSGKEKDLCEKCLLNNLDGNYEDAWVKCVNEKKCLDKACKDGFYGLEGTWQNKKSII
tara:strand:- start:110 stop:508 length:399 start_codon:yes stop_codon:yes gene_type:complete